MCSNLRSFSQEIGLREGRFACQRLYLAGTNAVVLCRGFGKTNEVDYKEFVIVAARSGVAGRRSAGPSGSYRVPDQP